MIAPFIVELKTYGQQVPLVVFGVIALLAGFLVKRDFSKPSNVTYFSFR